MTKAVWGSVFTAAAILARIDTSHGTPRAPSEADPATRARP